MTMTEGKKRVLNFTNKYKGKSVLFNTLPKEEQIDYVLLKSYVYFKGFLSTKEAIKRAIENAEAHQISDFKTFKENLNEYIIIGKE